MTLLWLPPGAGPQWVTLCEPQSRRRCACDCTARRRPVPAGPGENADPRSGPQYSPGALAQGSPETITLLPNSGLRFKSAEAEAASEMTWRGQSAGRSHRGQTVAPTAWGRCKTRGAQTPWTQVSPCPPGLPTPPDTPSEDRDKRQVGGGSGGSQRCRARPELSRGCRACGWSVSRGARTGLRVPCHVWPPRAAGRLCREGRPHRRQGPGAGAAVGPSVWLRPAGCTRRPTPHPQPRSGCDGAVTPVAAPAESATCGGSGRSVMEAAGGGGGHVTVLPPRGVCVVSRGLGATWGQAPGNLAVGSH